VLSQGVKDEKEEEGKDKNEKSRSDGFPGRQEDLHRITDGDGKLLRIMSFDDSLFF
jgi:hypothetical protein